VFISSCFINSRYPVDRTPYTRPVFPPYITTLTLSLPSPIVLYPKALAEYSESVQKQRDHFGEQLRQKESEVEKERMEREALSQRILELQSKVRAGVVSKGRRLGETVCLACDV